MEVKSAKLNKKDFEISSILEYLRIKVYCIELYKYFLFGENSV